MNYTYDGGGQRRNGGRGVAAAALILSAALTLRGMWVKSHIRLPPALSDALSSGERYSRAFAELGGAFSGGAVTDTLRQAYESAFADTDAAGGENGGEGEPYTVTVSPLDPEEYEYAWAEPEVPEEIFSEDADAVSAFVESQRQYTDRMELPANVTYDMPELDADCVCPAEGCVSSSFGYRVHPVDGKIRFHYGTDVAAPAGTAVSAFSGGTVRAVGDSASYGTYIIIDHPCGAVTLYAHLSRADVSAGDAVAPGDGIGAVGSTGNATGPCLHFEIRIGGQYVNPEYYVSWT